MKINLSISVFIKKSSSTLKKTFSASLKRSISADPNPKGIGIVEKDASKYFKTSSFKSRKQSFNPGSYAICKTPIKVSIKKILNLSVIILYSGCNSIPGEIFVIVFFGVFILTDPLIDTT